MKRILCVIVTYNRIEYLKKLLDSLDNQRQPLTSIFILDNCSSDGTKAFFQKLVNEDIIDKKLYNCSKYLYYRNDSNKGGAGGFHDAFKIALSLDKFDYFWVMDDDVIPDENCLLELMKFQNHQTMITIPNRSDDNYDDNVCLSIDLNNPFKIFMHKKEIKKASSYNNKTHIDVTDMPFEGPLINVELINKVGLPDSNYFLQFDDTDYATRSIQYTNIAFIINAHLYKQIKSNNVKKRRFLNWKDYYAYRNDIIFCKKYGKNSLVKYLTPLLLYLNMCLKAIFKFKYKNIIIMTKAFKDGISGNSGKTVEPGEF